MGVGLLVTVVFRSIWLVASTIPLLAGFLALGIGFDSPLETLGVAWITLAAIGAAVALPWAWSSFASGALPGRD